MSELTYYKALSAILYVIVALMFYSRCNQLIAKHGGAEKILNDDEMGEQQAVAISKTASLLFSLFWPFGLLMSALRGKK